MLHAISINVYIQFSLYNVVYFACGIHNMTTSFDIVKFQLGAVNRNARPCIEYARLVVTCYITRTRCYGKWCI